MRSGDRVALRRLTADEAKLVALSYHQAAGRDDTSMNTMALVFCQEHNDYQVEERDQYGDIRLTCMPCLQGGTKSTYWACPAWVKPHSPTLVCICSTPHDCECGAMEAEMAAKGKRKNPITKLWERVQ